MALISYPKSLKLPLISNYQLSQQSNLLRTPMSSGSARVRKRFTSTPTIFPAKWKLDGNSAIAFEGFVVHGTNDTVNWFVMPIRTPEGVIEHEVRFITNPLESVSYDDGYWKYSANLEIRKRKVPTEESTVTEMLKPNSINEFVTGISDALDSYQE